MSEEQSSSGGEFERERVPEPALLDAGKFWGMYAGEHAGGTEFMIGPLFLAARASRHIRNRHTSYGQRNSHPK